MSIPNNIPQDIFSVAPNITAKLVFGAFPNVEFFTQKTPIPSISAVFPNVQAPRINVPMPPQSIIYPNFNIEFIVMEDISNYRTLVDWMQNSLTTSVTDAFHNASLILLSPQKTPVQTVTFVDAIPIALSELTWSTTEDVVRYQTCIATFRYTYFQFEPLHTITQDPNNLYA